MKTLTCDLHKGCVVTYEALSYGAECPVCQQLATEETKKEYRERMAEIRNEVSRANRILDGILYD